MKKFNEILGDSMRTVKADLRLINDYSTGTNNGEIKTVECLVSDKDDIEAIKEYIEEKYALNMDDMWEVIKTSY